MGQLSRSLILQVPAELVYKVIKFTDTTIQEDLLKGSPQIAYSKDIPNKMVVAEASKWMMKVQSEYIINRLGDESCELQIIIKYPRLSSESLIKPQLAIELYAYKYLEIAYNAGKESSSSNITPKCSNCGKELKEDFDFCPSCGTKTLS